MRVELLYRDGECATFINGDVVELDLDGINQESLFSVSVFDVNNRLVFSAYHWHNDPKQGEDK